MTKSLELDRYLNFLCYRRKPPFLNCMSSIDHQMKLSHNLNGIQGKGSKISTVPCTFFDPFLGRFSRPTLWILKTAVLGRKNLKFGPLICHLTPSIFDTFHFWHFPFLTLSNSDTFRFWHFPILKKNAFWHFSVSFLYQYLIYLICYHYFWQVNRTRT